MEIKIVKIQENSPKEPSSLSPLARTPLQHIPMHTAMDVFVVFDPCFSLLIGATVSTPRRGGEQEQKLLQHKNNKKKVKKRSELAPTNVFCLIPSSPCEVHNLDTETCLFTSVHSKNPRRF